MSESPGVVPTVISQPAWEAAMIIMELVGAMLAEAGYKHIEGRSRSTETVAKLIQHAINRGIYDEAQILKQTVEEVINENAG